MIPMANIENATTKERVSDRKEYGGIRTRHAITRFPSSTVVATVLLHSMPLFLATAVVHSGRVIIERSSLTAAAWSAPACVAHTSLVLTSSSRWSLIADACAMRLEISPRIW